MASGKSSFSRLSGMRNLSPSERLQKIAEARGLNLTQLEPLKGEGALPVELADGMIENVIGKFELPMGVATNFIINGKEVLVPMAVEEPSVIAAASYMARLVRDHGGFQTSSTAPVMRAQIQLLGASDLAKAKDTILENRDEIIALANAQDALLVQLGGGCKDIEIHLFEESPVGPMLVTHLLVDVRDAMGANTVNTMAEAVAMLTAEYECAVAEQAKGSRYIATMPASGNGS